MPIVGANLFHVFLDALHEISSSRQDFLGVGNAMVTEVGFLPGTLVFREVGLVDLAELAEIQTAS